MQGQAPYTKERGRVHGCTVQALTCVTSGLAVPTHTMPRETEATPRVSISLLGSVSTGIRSSINSSLSDPAYAIPRLH